LGIDESGANVFFTSADSLVPQAVGSQSSWYDARIKGGFPAPASELSCSGETCQGAPSAPPVFAEGPSLTTAGVSSSSPPTTQYAPKPAAKPKAKSCKKGTYLKKGRCVKTPKSKKAKRAGNKRGAK
jgi:hypothetical protein